MIPLRDANPTRTRPYVVYVIIAVNVVVWLYEVMLGDAGMQAFVQQFGAVPHALTSGDLLTPNSEGGSMGSLITPLTSMFMHGGWMHIIGNMWFLWVFGDNVEDTLGKGRFVFFYLASGLGAAAAQVLAAPDSMMPMVGASGAISGVMAGYVLLYPRARVLTLIPIFIFIQFVELPAFIFIFVWFGLQLLSGWISLGAGDTGGVAWFAHVGGFIVGLALTYLLKPRKRRPEPPRRPDPRPDYPEPWSRQGRTSPRDWLH